MAFGEVLFDEHTTETNMPYLFNGKELDQETGLYYYGARYYDPRVSIFLNVDPLAEKYPFTSPYTYTNNNPVMLIDPDGKAAMPPDDHFDHNGKFLYTDNRKTNNIIIHVPYIRDNSNVFQSISNSLLGTKYGIEKGINQVQLKDYKFNTVKDFTLLNNIAKHYAKYADVDIKKLHNGNFSVGAFNNVTGVGLALSGNKLGFNDGVFWGITEKGEIPMMHTSENKVTIDIYKNRIADSFLNDKYNFISVLSHEGSSKGHLGLPNAKHSTIYENQKQRPLFKYTTPKFKEHVENNIKHYKRNED
ncbi:RHS repeat-associated core domain-containing protein [Riemerella columbina]|uniref:RHS repeat-associated core domain-containing protein n=1 Tax=Riemerella columbina TaxID=103810 RepID=UPI0024802B50|nr:RHS repeat-associated core domain-containing protein [Riemerella columbina]